MKAAIRALSLASIVLWVAILVFSVTAIQSVMNLDFQVGEIQTIPVGERVIFSLPFQIKNSGYYDIATLNVTTQILDYTGISIEVSETLIPVISRGNRVETAHNISINVYDVMSTDYIHLVLHDSFFDLQTFVSLNFAHAFPIQISLNASMPWGAPFSNFSVGDISVSPEYNSTHGEIRIPVTFENHSILAITGTLHLEILNDKEEVVTSGQTEVTVQPGNTYQDQINTYPSLGDAAKFTESGRVHLIFESPMRTVEWWTSYG
jgi:hypothetical protein